jgi:hypothetical protein
MDHEQSLKASFSVMKTQIRIRRGNNATLPCIWRRYHTSEMSLPITHHMGSDFPRQKKEVKDSLIGFHCSFSCFVTVLLGGNFKSVKSKAAGLALVLPIKPASVPHHERFLETKSR